VGAYACQADIVLGGKRRDLGSAESRRVGIGAFQPSGSAQDYCLTFYKGCIEKRNEKGFGTASASKLLRILFA
jgi:hypothetical protein